MVLTNPQLKRFAWHAAYFQQWHTFIHVLDTLRVNPLRADAEKAWQLIGSIYENTPDMGFDTRKPIHVAVSNLCLKAYGDREGALQNGKTCPPPTPAFILQLRQQREAVKVKRKARDAKSSRPEDLFSHGQEDARNTSPEARGRRHLLKRYFGFYVSSAEYHITTCQILLKPVAPLKAIHSGSSTRLMTAKSAM